MSDAQVYDVIIVGGGSAGCAMAHVFPSSVDRPTMRTELLSSRTSHQAPYTSGPDCTVRSDPGHAPLGVAAAGGCNVMADVAG